ncbi:MAG TPA: MotA/TolQ/ExbB proton channel family protein [Kiritimatiellia bacterium]|nr:MotA/TolQ/ExbB proton channel family protein [Kiritimatiellia bacterium]HPJ57368.1 MotA/TolQ/ExbB proton channel family protein [Kiritimatiellia bacterium]HPR68446.1 MotA/TolQ/ExbB proton channel family protein [Kiritimatiellia bacterium]HRX05959.1 MotA/TolQ/ExbB proton channel family protein [Kiritimatiellia bacterium]
MAKEEVAEQGGQLGQQRANTDVNVWIQLSIAAVLTFLISIGLHYAGKAGIGGLLGYLNGLINQRGPVQWLELLCFFVVVLFMILKSRIIRYQIQHIYDDTAQLSSMNMDNEDDLQLLRKRIHDEGLDEKSILLGRLDRGLALWLATKDVGRVGSWMGSEASRDNAMSDLTYTLARTMMWAIPILGFIGTVQGLSSAVGGFGDFLSGAADLAAIKGAIADVTIGLGVAFDTTFLALMLVTIIQFPLSSVMRREATLLGEIEVYIDEHFVSRLPSAEQQAVVIENLEDSIEAAFRRYIPDPDRYEEVFTESIEKAGTVVEKQFESFTQKYVDARKQATDDEVQALAGALESAHLKAAELANQYARSADGIQTALGDSLAKAAQAAGDVAKQVDTIADLGAKIQELLQVEQALERAVAGIAGADEFQKTFAQLREHLATTDEFCRRLSKPRVITLHEEVVT